MLRSPFKRRSKQSNGSLPTESIPRSLSLVTAGGETILSLSDTVAESLRYLLVRLRSRNEFPSTLALTSTLRGEGVTYISRALGAVMANDFPASVCVVELNWWRPAVRPASTTAEKGLAAVVLGERSLEEMLITTNYPNLALLPAGQVSGPERPVLANGQRLADTISEIGNHFDYVILDLPAVLATSEVIPLVSLAESSMLVIRHGAASFDKLEQAVDDISHIPTLGAIMNQVELATPMWMLKYMPSA
jgi:Mrp family chromosome partitioning ATPase